MASQRLVTGSAEDILELLRAWDAEDDPSPLVVATSGSTGEPKRVLLSRRAMRASVAATHERLGGPGRWVLNLPPTGVAGLQVLFRSVRAGLLPVAASGLVEARDKVAGGRSYVSLVPTQLVRVLADDAEREAAAAFDAVLVGGGPLSPKVRAEAEDAGIRVVQTYGMSETCGGCVYDGHPLDGVAVKVDGDGQVLLRGPVLFDGYEGEPERTAYTVVDGWLRTNDLGALDHDGRLSVLGRVDDVVISGGVKVPPVAVERMLSAHPQVQDVAVVGVPDPEWGQRVVAVTVGEAPLDELRDLVEPRTWAPRGLVLVEDLPLLPSGKLDRRAAQALAARDA